MLSLDELNLPAEKVYFSISEVSKLFDLPYSTLRYWESQFTMLKPDTNGHQTRFYSREDLLTIQKIKYFRDSLHLSLPAIKLRLSNMENDVDKQMRLSKTLHEMRDILSSIRELI